MRTFGERSRISCDLSLSLVEKTRHTDRTTTNTNLQKTKNNDFKTMSERTSAYTSECQISPKMSRTLAYAGPIRYSVTGPLYAGYNAWIQCYAFPCSSNTLYHIIRVGARILGPIQGGPERMQQLWSLISRTLSIKQNCFFFYWVENSFSNKMTPWPLILGKAFGY